MTDEQGYNGWTNYETWVTALWIDNDEGSYNLSRELVEQVRIDITDERPDVQSWDDVADEQSREVGRAADVLKEWIEEMMYEWEPESTSVFTDLLHAAFSEVNWYEIADNYLTELASA